MRKLAKILIGVAIAVAPGFADPSICDAFGGNLVQNCGFETGDFTGWTVTNNDFGTLGNTAVINGYNHSGNYVAAFGTIGKDVSVSQTISDTAGTEYWFSFFFAAPGNFATPGIPDIPSDFSAEWNGTQLLSVVNPGPEGYTEYSYLVTGTGSDTITFIGRDDPNYLALDDVSVSLPEPSSLWAGALLVIFLLGSTWSAKSRNRRSLPF